MRLAIIAAGLLVLLAGAAFYYASSMSRSRGVAGDAHTVTIAGKTCEPDTLSVPAGRATFRIVNQSDRVVEWEILDGVMVLAERENIAPGITQTLTTKLVPGTYEITCGLLSNPRGTLVVTESAESAAEATRPPLRAFIGALAEYQLYLTLEAAKLVEETGALAGAIKAGDLEQAKAHYLPARVAYGHIEPVAARFADLAAAIDAGADYFERHEQDPAFKGFHRLEYGLFSQASTAELEPVADALTADVAQLQSRIGSQQLPPERLADGAAQALAGMAQAKIPRGSDPYAHIDLAVFQAEFDGSRKVVDLLRPLLSKAKPELVGELDGQFAAVAAELGQTAAGGWLRAVRSGDRRRSGRLGAGHADARRQRRQDQCRPGHGMRSRSVMADTPSLPADRRRILLGLGAAGGIMAGGLRQPSAATAGADIGNVTAAPPSDDTGQRHPFYGRHQAGVTTPRPAAGMVASFDVVATTPAELMQLFQRLTERAAFLTQGGVPPALDPRLPPPDSGILGPVVTPDNLTFTVSVGASLFDDRFGLAARRPTQLSRMSRFRNDALDAGLCHGDLSVQLCANTPDTIIHALRDVVKNLPDLMVLRWVQSGSVPVLPAVAGKPPESARNFLGFRDGSANPDSADAPLMDRLVWVQRRPGRAGMGHRRHLSGRPDHPQFRRALGSHAAA